MNLLLDTCALLSLAGRAGKLPKNASDAVAGASSVAVCAVSPWEIAIKVKSGKLRLKRPVPEWFEEARQRYRLEEVPLSAALLCAAADLPLVHRDPFDRVLVAAALERGLTIVTSDRTIPGYPGVKTVW